MAEGNRTREGKSRPLRRFWYIGFMVQVFQGLQDVSRQESNQSGSTSPCARIGPPAGIRSVRRISLKARM